MPPGSPHDQKTGSVSNKRKPGRARFYLFIKRCIFNEVKEETGTKGNFLSAGEVFKQTVIACCFLGFVFFFFFKAPYWHKKRKGKKESCNNRCPLFCY